MPMDSGLKTRGGRTLAQNRSLHLLMTQISDGLNDSGLYMQRVLRHDAEIAWTPEAVKEYLFRPFITAMYSISSTKDLDTKQIGDAMNMMLDHLAKVTGKSFDIPSIESLLINERINHGGN